MPVAIETSGVWGRKAVELVNEIGRRIAALTYEPRSTAFLRSSQAASLTVFIEHEHMHYLTLTVH